MRPERLHLTDIVDAADAIAAFLQGVESERFVHDDLMQSAVLHKLTIIGEAASRLPAAFRKAHASVNWPAIIAFRNIAVHAYFSVDWRIVWVTATQDVPQLRRQVATILAEEFPTSE